ncbi:glycosyltransferase family 2 protein [Hymenobacter sp. NBH84]|uniref:glycosyltransferase family 2 protein n=1 Tax=Hymenobacter sp. NBH84 TaxID=2596915 RepID=UPI0016252740|nr:glycosyltransferase [Hymenobacter sp. NBH84]QNE38905.1 glycosyltransferase family 2 protein [Hymenobacter sp. NBH84]
MKSSLSILIPVYNRAVAPLVEQLRMHLPDWDGPVEICLLDDASRPEIQAENRPLGLLPNVRYNELPRNVGRAAIRNQLAAAARHEWLLMLDNDVLLPDAQFLTRYDDTRALASVVVGGITCATSLPTEPTLRLRWYYTQQREALPAARRRLLPPAQLIPSNLLIRAEVFRLFGFDEALTRYGHEDSKLGWQLAQAGISIHHLDNPVVHDGLDPAPEFLRKSRAAVYNLVLLYHKDGVGADSQLLRTALRLQRVGLRRPVAALLRRLRSYLHANLCSATPRLVYFDLLKLYWVLQELTRVEKARHKKRPAA